MSLLKISIAQRRNSLFALKRPYRSMISAKNSYIHQKLDSLLPENNNQKQKEEVCNIKPCCSIKVYNGEPLVDNEMPKAQMLSSHQHILKEEVDIPSLPPLPSLSDSTFDQIFYNKIKICNYLYDFMKPFKHLKGKMEKTKALKEINALLSNNSNASLLTDQNKDLIYGMITRNIFEQDPFLPIKSNISLTINLKFTECSWEHLSLIFNILNQCILLFPDRFNFDLVKKGIRLMNIYDANERDNLVTFLKNYTKVHHEQFNQIWTQLKCALSNVRYNIYSYYCIEPIITYMFSQLLSSANSFCSEYLSSILYSHLLPLFDGQYLSIYFNKLLHLIIQIIEKNYDDKLKVIQYLLKHFPIQCGQKQPLFVSALTSITNTMDFVQLNPIASKIFSFIAMSIKLPNSKLVESALNFLMKPNFKPIIFLNYENAMNILNEPLKLASTNYWEKSIKDQSSTALLMLTKAKLEFQKNISLSDYIHDSKFSNSNQEIKTTDNKKMAITWGMLARAAAKRDRTIDLTKSLFNIQSEFRS